jgi:eukaryotic-like serine/threonine-protein kinase
MSLAAGTRLGPYEIVAPIGAGGMGEVYRAHDTRLGRDVAVKILPEAFAADVDRRTRFEREARAIAALSHPNILAIFDVGSYQPSGDASAQAPIMCMVTELLDGESLRARMDGDRLPVSKAVDCARQIASGLAAAHAKGITHRDIKPENVFVTKDGRVKILDFGLTKQANDTPEDATRLQSVTAAGVVLGTVGYMSPEQVRGEVADARSDIFSFGVVLYELLAGERPFRGETAVQTMNAILTEDPPELVSTGRALPPAFERVVRHCLEKNPEERFQSARDLAFALDALSSSSAPSSAIAAIEPVRPRRRLLPIVTAALAVVTLLLAVLVWGRPAPGVDLNAYRYTPFSFEPGGQGRPAWSPDGTAVAFTAGMKSYEPFQVFVRYLDAPVAIQLTHDPSPTLVLGWMPDGKRIVYRRGRTLWSVATVGGEPEPMPLPEDATSIMALAPDGTAVAMVRADDKGRAGIWTTSPIGAPLKRYEPDPFATDAIFNSPLLFFSPDGRHILLSWTTVRGNELWLLPYPANPADPPRQVLTNLASYSGTTDVNWMPDNRHVVMPLQLSPGAASQLWLADLQSGERHAITGGTHSIYRGVASPDGTRMIVSEATGSSIIVQVDLQTAAVKALISGGRYSQMPAWAADVPQLVYVSDRNGAQEIWLHGAGSGDRPIVSARDFPPDTTQWFMVPALSPKADRVIYARIERAPGGGLSAVRLWISSIAGGTPVPLTNDTPVFVTGGAWSPDGNWFVYEAPRDGKTALMKVKTSGQATPEVLKDDVGQSIPSWSRAGTWITYATKNGDDHVISPDGKTDRRLGQWPTKAWVFSADEKLLYGLRADGDRELLFSADVATGAEKVIGDVGRKYEPSSDLNPGIRFSLAPDGKSFAYAVDQATSNLWLMEGFAPKPGLLEWLHLR